MRYLILLLSLSFAWLPRSCAPVDRQQLTNEVLRADPAFSTTLEKYRFITNRTVTYQNELALKRGTVERQIAQLNQELAATTETIKKRTAELKARLRPDQERLELALAMASEELSVKRAQRASVGRSIAKLRKTLKSPQGTWTAAESATHQQQLDEMVRDAARLDRERADLNQHIRLLKIKSLLIRLY